MKKVLYKFQLEKKQKGMSLITFLKLYCKDISTKSLKRSINAKLCTVNGKIEQFSTYILEAGDVVVLYQLVDPLPRSLQILYQDEYLLICNKPPMLTSDMRVLQPLIKGRWMLGHRLDKETSGALILVKNSHVLQKLILLFRKHSVEKYYLAIVDKQILQEEGKIDNTIAKFKSYQGQSLYKVANMPGSQRAVTLWRCLKRCESASLLLCQPLTGRTHQLRVHLHNIGHPILGDVQYSKNFFCKISPVHHLLHAYILRFPHPISGQTVKVRAELPPSFKEYLKQLEMTHAV